ncbi:MAG TPA: hypothetical protein VD713_07695, partial [Sphingomonadales bacterium]|nr:hypothetical protein [Sphingomonadales bacterium]
MPISRRKILCGSALLAAGAGGYRLMRGFEDDPAEDAAIPAALRGAGLDVHVHAMGVGTGGTGCWMSQEMRKSIQTW